MRRLILALICVAGLASEADAHASLEKATPPVGGSVSAAPKEVAITFSEPVEPAFSSIQVTDASGKRVDEGKVHTAPGDAQTLLIDLPGLAAGVYKVTWRAVSVDAHKTKGSYSFTVAP